MKEYKSATPTFSRWWKISRRTGERARFIPYAVNEGRSGSDRRRCRWSRNPLLASCVQRGKVRQDEASAAAEWPPPWKIGRIYSGKHQFSSWQQFYSGKAAEKGKQHGYFGPFLSALRRWKIGKARCEHGLSVRLSACLPGISDVTVQRRCAKGKAAWERAVV